MSPMPRSGRRTSQAGLKVTDEQTPAGLRCRQGDLCRAGKARRRADRVPRRGRREGGPREDRQRHELRAMAAKAQGTSAWTALEQLCRPISPTAALPSSPCRRTASARRSRTSPAGCLMRVTKITPGSSKSLDEVKEDIRKDLLKQLAQAKIVDITNAFTDARQQRRRAFGSRREKTGMKFGHIAGRGRARPGAGRFARGASRRSRIPAADFRGRSRRGQAIPSRSRTAHTMRSRSAA